MDDETIEILRDIRTYVRSLAAAAMREAASKIIDTREKAEAYERLSGTRTHKEISRLIGVPRKTISNWVGEFVSWGLAVDLPESYDRALFSLAELNISVESLKRRGKSLKSR